jgi:hypothetical protein
VLIASLVSVEVNRISKSFLAAVPLRHDPWASLQSTCSSQADAGQSGRIPAFFEKRQR